MKKCQYCAKEHDKAGLFCSITCANKDKIAKLAKRSCVICDTEFQPKSLSAKYCKRKTRQKLYKLYFPSAQETTIKENYVINVLEKTLLLNKKKLILKNIA